METTDEELHTIQESFITLTDQFVRAGISPLAIAAMLSKISFMVYKTCLTQEEYERMTDFIHRERDMIKSLQEWLQESQQNNQRKLN